MKTAEERGEARDKLQAGHSWSAMLGTWIWSRRGRYVFNLSYMVVLMTFTAVASWNAANEHSITIWRAVYADLATKTYEATVENRCMGWAILSRLDPDKWPFPEWCVPVIGRLHNAPASTPPIEEAIRREGAQP